MNGIGTRIVETDRLLLRPAKLSDASEMFKNWTSNPLSCRFLPWGPDKTIEPTRNYLEEKVKKYQNPNYYSWVVVLKSKNQLIGEIDTRSISICEDYIELGYVFGSKFWHKGYASEALTAAIDFLFTKADVKTIYAKHIAINIASGKVMMRSGMHFYKCLKNFDINPLSKERCDTLVYKIEK